ncbi:MAG: response regulator, partial [Desulfobacterales bacterium]|nr:response regulator [Desulfobacterales bacterium]
MGPSSPCKSRPVVMVVEDQRLVALDIADELRAFGYEVPPTASSGEDAVGKAREIQPDLILMDIRLEGEMDGITAGRIIRSQMDIPIVYLTAYSDDATLARAKAAEPFGYLIKPFDAVELKTTIEMALYKHSAERRLKESERWLTTTLRSIGDGVLATDSSGCLTFMNPVAEALTGWRQAEAAGRSAATVFRAVSGEGSGCTAAGIDQSIQQGISIELPEDTRLVGRNGRAIDISGSICPICDDAGR